MSLKNIIRQRDVSGAQINLLHEGEAKVGTMCGGILTLLVQLVIAAYFCTRLQAVISHQDPQITSYSISEDRANLESSINLAEYRQALHFGFVDRYTLRPKPLAPEIGRFLM